MGERRPVANPPEDRTVLLREASEGDMWKILWLRNNPLVLEGTYTQGSLGRGLIRWREHLAWWRSRKNWRIFLIDVHEDEITREAGILQLALLDYWGPEMAIYLAPHEWGLGIAREALQLGLDWLRGQGYKYSRTTILETNLRSIAAFEAVGYKKVGPARPGESFFQLTL